LEIDVSGTPGDPMPAARRPWCSSFRGAPQQRALLAVLVLHRGEAVSSDRLIDEIWGEQPPASANMLIHGVAPPGTRPRDLRSSYITCACMNGDHGGLLMPDGGVAEATAP
jgi:hypothetical protein